MATSKIKGRTRSEKDTSYGKIYITEQGGLVNITGSLSGLPTSAWTTVASGMPIPNFPAKGTMPDGSSAGYTTINITASGVLQFYGRSSYSTCELNITYAV